MIKLTIHRLRSYLGGYVHCAGSALAFACVLALAAPTSHAQTESERFNIDRFVVEGNTLLSTEEIEALLKPFTGAKREYGDVQRALEALELRYREKGYSAVQVHVPEQELGGNVKLTVLEPSIRRVAIEGNNFFTQSNIRAALPAVQNGSSEARRLDLTSTAGIGPLLPPGADSALLVGTLAPDARTANVTYRGPAGYPLRFLYRLMGDRDISGAWVLDRVTGRWRGFVARAALPDGAVDRVSDGDTLILILR